MNAKILRTLFLIGIGFATQKMMRMTADILTAQRERECCLNEMEEYLILQGFVIKKNIEYSRLTDAFLASFEVARDKSGKSLVVKLRKKSDGEIEMFP